MVVEDIVEFILSLGVCIVKLLADSVVLVNVLGLLHPHVQLVAIHHGGDAVAQVLWLVNPRQWSVT